MAGPELTPANFQHGLFNARFPNPGSGGAPYHQGAVGFPRVHTMQQDLAMIWLSSQHSSDILGRPRSFCYVGKGERYGLGEWPEEDPRFHEGSCR